jgi:ATP-dependent 26S proteasome regulatory subunit
MYHIRSLQAQPSNIFQGSQIRSKIVGASEKTIADLFKQCRANSPSVLFLDQVGVVCMLSLDKRSLIM